MEFYDGVRDGIDQFIRFQFPTGWNSTKSASYVSLLLSSFQFPTGWNSTLLPAHSLEHNRHRFNSQRDGILRCTQSKTSQKSKRFNSQRDGILQIVVYAIFLHIGGFNSQRDGILRFISAAKASGYRSFNSQRDGILLIDFTKHTEHLCSFQFPTGWNSTRAKSPICRKQNSFQFPTGWNSTARILPFF